jgi:serine/threonine-protein kinase
MGQVFLARQRGEHGIQRLVALKRMLVHHTRNKKFVNLFLDEVRIASQLNHGNIVQVIDHGIIEGQYFMAMEYVHGENLLELLVRLHARGEQMPLDLVLQIGSCVCQGLDYAHRKQSIDGKPLGIVHRDTSPQNILLSFQGEVKIADFGVARAAEQTHQTLGGELKGKLAYMSPEQAYGQELDHRSDLFSLGVVLYEALSNRSPFMRDNPMATLEAVRASQVVSLATLRPELPDEVVTMVHRALSRDVERRPDSARSMYEELQQTMRLHNMVVSAFDLADYLVDLFPESRPRDLPGDLHDAPTEVGRRADQSVELERMTLFYLRQRHPELERASLVTGEVKVPSNRRRALLGVILAAALLAGGGFALHRLLTAPSPPAVARVADGSGRPSPDGNPATAAVADATPAEAATSTPTSPAALTITSVPPGASVQVDGRRLPGTTPLTTRLKPGAHACAVGLKGFHPWRKSVMLAPGRRATTLEARLDPLPGRLTVRSTHSCRVLLNGRPRGRTPLSQKVQPGSVTITCVDEKKGLRATRQIRVPPGGSSVTRFRFGSLSVNVEPWAQVLVNRRLRGTTPLYLVLPEGEHQVTLRNKDRGLERSRVVEVRASRTARISSW